MARTRCLKSARPATRRAVLAAVTMLCVSALLPAATPKAAHAPMAKKRKAQPKLTAEQKSLHALDRLTFGPRPGEVAAVTREGVNAWFEQQLHPERIPEGELAARLSRYPALQLPQSELMARFPSQQRLRQYTSGKLAAPSDPAEQIIYKDAAYSYGEKREAKQTKQEAKGAPEAMSTPPASGPAVASPANPEAESVDQMAVREALFQMPAPARLQRLYAMSPEEMHGLRASLKGADQQRLLAGMAPAEVEQVEAMQSPEKMVTAEVLSARLLRDLYSERQLQAVMADFWLNHFNVYLRKNQEEPYLLPSYERDAILPHALGRFEDLLVATAKSPAMLVYLDNWQSLGPHSRAAQRADAALANRADLLPGAVPAPRGINENYARELMELHTLGVEGGYTQADVIEVAKCFTGWTIDRPAYGSPFQFNPNRHEPGAKTVLGHVIAESGMGEGLQVLHILATSPSTAHLVSLQLAQRFVSDTPPPPLVASMTATFLHSDGDIKAVLTTMFHSPEFWSAGVFRAKVKTPLEFVTSALRATDAEVSNPLSLVQALDRLGMPLYGKQTPNGYSPLAEDWVSSNALLTRMNFALVLSGNRLAGTRLDWPALLGGAPGTATMPDQVTEGRLEKILLGQSAAAQTRSAALQGATAPGLQQLAEQSFRAVPVSMGVTAGTGAGGDPMRARARRRSEPANTPDTPLATVGGLLLGSPDFQHR